MDEVQSGNELGDEFNRGRATSRGRFGKQTVFLESNRSFQDGT